MERRFLNLSGLFLSGFTEHVCIWLNHLNTKWEEFFLLSTLELVNFGSVDVRRFSVIMSCFDYVYTLSLPKLKRVMRVVAKFLILISTHFLINKLREFLNPVFKVSSFILTTSPRSFRCSCIKKTRFCNIGGSARFKGVNVVQERVAQNRHSWFFSW